MEYHASMRKEAPRDTGLQILELTQPWMKHTRWASRYESASRDILVNITKIRARSLGREPGMTQE
jgi:hypothetical protein